jgi:transposase
MIDNPEIELWAIDEVMFQQHGSRCKMWIPPEDRDPVIFHHPTRKKVGYWGAVRLLDGKFVYQRETDMFNAETCFRFFKYLRKISARSSRNVAIILDNARYHHAKLHKEWREWCSEVFSFEYLPPYCPDLNPIERVWKLTRRRCTHNEYFPEIENVISSVENQFDCWKIGNESLRRLCAMS